jgi:hypothetical protein
VFWSAFNAFMLQPRRWLPLNALLLLALFVRLPSMAGYAHESDSRHFAAWMRVIDDHGVWQFYDADLRMDAQDRTYPPLSTLSFAALVSVNGFAPDPRFALDNPAFVILLKVFPVICELALVAAVYLWLIDRLRLRWLIPGALAVAPGLIATSSWWGQYDAPFTLFLVLALIALNRDRPILAWLLFAAALLLKQPAAVFAPILLVVTFRRYGARKLILGMIGGGALYAAVSLPFVLNSGFADALSPYLRASDAFPYLSNNAYNLWFALATIHKGSVMLFREPAYADALTVLGGISYKLIGLALFGGFALLIAAVCWRQARQQREFLWSAALFFGFFLLPTQVHERYLYPGVVLLLIAVAQDRRLLLPALIAVLTYSYNIYAVTLTWLWDVPIISPYGLALPTALVNVAVFCLLVYRTVIRGARQTLDPSLMPSAVASPHII